MKIRTEGKGWKWVTSDKIEHATHTAAMKHAQERYWNELERLAKIMQKDCQDLDKVVSFLHVFTYTSLDNVIPLRNDWLEIEKEA